MTETTEMSQITFSTPFVVKVGYNRDEPISARVSELTEIRLEWRGMTYLCYGDGFLWMCDVNDPGVPDGEFLLINALWGEEDLNEGETPDSATLATLEAIAIALSAMHRVA